MIVVFPYAYKKDTKSTAGYLRRHDGQKVKFVANLAPAPEDRP